MAQKNVILCIDDEPTILQALKTELKSIFDKDFLIEVAEDGKDALDLVNELLAESYEIFLVISDYLMPEMKGDEVLKMIHQQSPESITIMLTGQATIEGVANAVKNAKLYRYIAKPWQIEDFKLTVKEAINTYIKNSQLKIKNQRLEELNKEQNALIEQLHQKEKSLQQSLYKEIKLKEASSRFVPEEYLSFLQKESLIDVHLGDHVTDVMTVMFSDLRSFTSISEEMTPQQNFDFINAYLGRVSPLVRKNSGFIVKYLGDGLMAIFPDNADSAVQAGIDKLKQVNIYNAECVKLGLPSISVGIGVNTGYMMVGMVGEARRMQGDAFSDTVNIASRIENLSKHYSTSFIITAATKEALADASRYNIRFLDKVQVKGKQKPLSLYEVYDADLPPFRAFKQESQQQYEQAVQHYYSQEFSEAQSLLLKILKKNPDDKLVLHHLTKATQCLENGVTENWTDVTIMTCK